MKPKKCPLCKKRLQHAVMGSLCVLCKKCCDKGLKRG